MRDADTPRFRLIGCVRDRWFSLLMLGVCLILIAAMCSVLGVSRDGCIAVCTVVALAAAAALAVDLARRRRFWRQMDALVELVDAPYQALSLIEEPAFLEGRIAYGAVERIVDASNVEVTAARTEASDNRSYIELWIHEVKTPIAASKLVLSRMHGQEADILAREMERIEDQVEQALYCARADALSNDYAIREVALAPLIREACKRHARFLIERQTIPHIEVADDVSVLADRSWLTFMLGQVIVNAAQYGASSITFTSTDEDAGTSHGRTVLEVADDGCGIPAADVPRAFERAFTGRNGRLRGSATGIGLYLVARMCAQLGLGVSLASEEGTGTRVLFTFPHNRRALRDSDVSQV